MASIEDIQKSMGIMAEMGLMFFRSVIAAGGSAEEAERLTRSFLGCMLDSTNK